MKRLYVAATLTLLCPFVTLAQEKDTPQQAANTRHLQVLEPFFGHWVYEGPAKRTIPGLVEKGVRLRVDMDYRWAVDKNAILLTISIQSKGASEFKIIEMIGWDVKRQMIVSGAFNSAGGMSYGRWTVDQKKLSIKTRDVANDGTESNSTIIHELQDTRTMTWRETNRTVEGEKRSDSPIYEFKRVETSKNEPER